MAELTTSQIEGTLHRKTFQWTGATNGGSPDTFPAIQLGRIPYAVMVQATGNFSGSASIALHGSLDGTNYAALNDRAGTAIALTAAGLVSTGDAPVYIKPVMTSGDGSADIDVTLAVWFDSK